MAGDIALRDFSSGFARETAETYESVSCYACRQIHLVNPTTGRVLGIDDE
jgi:hypothetical protein